MVKASDSLTATAPLDRSSETASIKWHSVEALCDSCNKLLEMESVGDWDDQRCGGSSRTCTAVAPEV